MYGHAIHVSSNFSTEYEALQRKKKAADTKKLTAKLRSALGFGKLLTKDADKEKRRPSTLGAMANAVMPSKKVSLKDPAAIAVKHADQFGNAVAKTVRRLSKVIDPQQLMNSDSVAKEMYVVLPDQRLRRVEVCPQCQAICHNKF